MLNASRRLAYKSILTWWYVLKMSWRHLCKTSWRLLEDVFKTSWRSLEDVLKTFLQYVLRTYWQDVLKMSWRRFCKTSWRRLGKASWRGLENVLKTYGQDENIGLDQDVFWRRMSKANIFVLIKTSSEDEDERCLQDVFIKTNVCWGTSF